MTNLESVSVKPAGVAGFTAAVDLGGTHVRVAAVEESGSILHVARFDTPAEDPKPDFLVELLQDVAGKTFGGLVARRAVIGLPGIIDHVSDQLVSGPNLNPNWIEHLSASAIADAVGLPTSLANDADLAAVGEARFGAGQKFRDVVFVTISTGVGAGAVVDRSLVRGRFSGGELGHTVLDWSDAVHGRPATVEDLGSGTAIEQAATRAGISERGEAFAKLVRTGDKQATEIWNRAIQAVGVGIANMAWLVAPQVVVVGGGVGRNEDIVLPIIREQLERHGPAGRGDPIEVVVAELGDDAALVGAAAWWEAVGRD